MTFTRRATMGLATAVTSLTLLAGTAMAADPDYKSKIRIFYDTFNQNDPALLDQIIAEDWVHIPPNTPDEEPGREGFKKQVPGFAAVFKDGNLKIEDIIQEGNKVVVRSTYSGTQVGPFVGFEPKGRQFTIMTIDVHEFNDQGLVQTTWHLEDWMRGLFQMGAFDPK
ncbi:MAG: ester cyclase [Bauldia sp.]|nr:ester cyclase [Bauldia sp.]